MFSVRSAAEKPRSPLRPARSVSPSSRTGEPPLPNSLRSSARASVDLPEAGQSRQPDHRAVVAIARRALVGAQRGFHRHDIDGNGALPGIDRQHQAAAGNAAIDLDHQPPGARIVDIGIGRQRLRQRNVDLADMIACDRFGSRRSTVRRDRPPSRSRPRWRASRACRAGPGSRRPSSAACHAARKSARESGGCRAELSPTWAITSPRSMNNSRSSVMPTELPAVCGAVDRRHRPTLDGSDLRDLARGHDDDLVAGAKAAGFDASRDNAAVVEFIDRLHRQPQRELLQRPGRLQRIQRLDHGRTVVPADRRRCARRRHRHRAPKSE